MKMLKGALGGALVALLAFTGTAFADFSPQFSLELSNTKTKGNPSLDIHLEFDADDEEIGNFMLDLPAGYKIAADADVPDDEVIGGGAITIEAGPGCRPGPEGESGATAPASINATLYEKARNDDEADAGAHAVWLLDIEPLNRVRLVVTGSKRAGWHIEGAPTPSDNTCNPLIVDITINDKSESGVPLVKNPKKAGKYKIVAQIVSQDSPSVATFKKKVKITK